MRRTWLVLTTIAWAVFAAPAQVYVTPMLGGGQVAADMQHIDIFYDELSNRLSATIDDSAGAPTLRPLAASYEFDPSQSYAVLNGKAYNSQYGWNAGGQFAIPPGAGIWVELVSCSPGLETYSGYGRFASYTPIFGTAGSSRLWKWSGVMAHNTYALNTVAIPFQFASYHIYFGDALTGERGAYSSYGDTYITLRWSADLPAPQVLMFGAVAQTNNAPLSFLNAEEFQTNSQAVIHLHATNKAPYGPSYTASFRTLAVPASTLNGGPHTNHAAPGSVLMLQPLSLSGPPEGKLSVWEMGEAQPRCSLDVAKPPATNLIQVSETRLYPDSDPYGAVQGRIVSANKPGLYCLGFRVLDISTNGLHTPSPLYQVFIQAGFTIHSLARVQDSLIATFAGETNKVFYLERNSGLSLTGAWESVSGPVSGTNHLQTLVDTAPPSGASFYRLRVQ